MLGLAVSPGKLRVPYCEERPCAAHSRRDQMCVGVGGEPGKTATVIGTVPLKPLFKGQVGSVRGPDRARRHSPRRVD